MDLPILMRWRFAVDLTLINPAREVLTKVKWITWPVLLQACWPSMVFLNILSSQRNSCTPAGRCTRETLQVWLLRLQVFGKIAMVLPTWPLTTSCALVSYPSLSTLNSSETVESLFILYRVTGDSKYQEWGWKIFEALEKHCKTQVGFSGVRNVGQV